MNDKQLEILHEHYKETFARLRKAELSRDRLFLYVLGLFALLSVEIGYPTAMGASLGKLSIVGGELNLQALPLPSLLNATWVLTLAISLRYCQGSILINRQYPYLHSLEKAISPEVGGGDLYQREGRIYRSKYPILLKVIWFAYHILFPVIVMLATLYLGWSEYIELSYPPMHILFDVLIALALIILFFLYRIQPAMATGWRRWQAHRMRSK